MLGWRLAVLRLREKGLLEGADDGCALGGGRYGDEVEMALYSIVGRR